MDVEEYLRRSQLFRRLKCGPHGQLVERYAVRLIEERLVHNTARGDASTSSAACWPGSQCAIASWLISMSARSISTFGGCSPI